MNSHMLNCGAAMLALGAISFCGTASLAAEGADFGILGRLVEPAQAAPVAAAIPAPARKASRRAATGTGGPFRALIEKHASQNGVPYKLADAVVRIESRYNAHVVHAGNFGLMQIRHQTARGVGFSGSPAALLNPDTNLHYGVKYLAIAYRQAGGNTCSALRYYQSGIGARGMNGANRAYCRKALAIMANN